MLELEDALARILSQLPAPTPESILLNAAHGRIVSSAIRAPSNLPPFNNSSMDGYAIRAADVTTSSGVHAPVKLQLVGRVAAGQDTTTRVEPGQAVRVFTGSALPPGADAVVMQEDTKIDASDPAGVWVLDSVKPWENVRFEGEDVKRDSDIIAAGDRLTATRITLLAALGSREINATTAPRVGLLATGSELREPGGPLERGQIYESNRAALLPLIRSAGGVPHVFPIVPDDLSATRDALERAFAENDVVITCGGVSVGEMDFVKAAFEALEGRLDFWKVGIKPGRPFVFGRLGSKFLFGLPGNPVSAFVTFLLLVRPALLRWQGASETGLRTWRGELAETIPNPGSRRHFVRVRIDAAGKVRSAGMQASHALNALATANGLLDVPAGRTFAVGENVSVLTWD